MCTTYLKSVAILSSAVTLNMRNNLRLVDLRYLKKFDQSEEGCHKPFGVLVRKVRGHLPAVQFNQDGSQHFGCSFRAGFVGYSRAFDGKK